MSNSRFPVALAIAAAATAVASAPGTVLAWSQGPPADRVNLCSARLSCNDIMCHDSFAPDSGSAISTLALAGGPLPSTYKLDEILNLVLSVVDSDPSRTRFGFQIGAVSGCPFAVPAGSLAATDPGRTQLLAAPGGIEFVEHACTVAGSQPSCGYLPTPGPGRNAWAFDWQAPATYQGPITFYWAINSADGNGLPDNDFVALGLATLGPNCPGRITTLRAVERACDGGAPGAPRVELTWDPIPWSSDYHLYRTTDPLLLADPGSLGATLLSSSCDDPPASPALHFYTVVGVCADASDGPG